MRGATTSARSDQKGRAGAIGKQSGQTPASNNGADNAIRISQPVGSEGQDIRSVNTQVLRNAVGADRAINAVLRIVSAARDVCGGDGESAALRARVVDVLGVGVVEGQIQAMRKAVVDGKLQRVVGRIRR